MRYHLTHVRSLPSINQKVLVRMWRKGNTHVLLVDCKLVQPAWRSLKNKKIELPYDPAIPLLEIYLRKSKTPIWKDICILVLIAVLFTRAKIWKQLMSIYSKLDKVANIYNRILLSYKKVKSYHLQKCEWKIKCSKSEKYKYHMISLMWDLMNKINKQNRNRPIDREQTDSCWVGRKLEGWVKKVKGLRSTNLQLQNSHRDVQYSIGNIVNNVLITTLCCQVSSRLIKRITS